MNDFALLHKELLPFSARWGFYFIDYLKNSPARSITPVQLKAIKPDLCRPLLWAASSKFRQNDDTVLLLYLTFWHQAWRSCATLARRPRHLCQKRSTAQRTYMSLHTINSFFLPCYCTFLPSDMQLHFHNMLSNIYLLMLKVVQAEAKWNFQF